MQEESSLGGKRKNTLIVGKIYADWCGHCVALMPEWKKLKEMMKQKRIDNTNIIFKEIGDTKENKKKGIAVDALIANFNKNNRANLEPIKIDGGFPTIFKIYNGKLEYYKGERNAASILTWASSNLKSKTNAYFPEKMEKTSTFADKSENKETIFSKIMGIFAPKGKTMKKGGRKSRRFIRKNNKSRKVKWA
jgi:hypothetical protein